MKDESDWRHIGLFVDEKSGRTLLIFSVFPACVNAFTQWSSVEINQEKDIFMLSSIDN